MHVVEVHQGWPGDQILSRQKKRKENEDQETFISNSEHQGGFMFLFPYILMFPYILVENTGVAKVEERTMME